MSANAVVSRVLPKLKLLKPRRIKTCVLLDKPSRRIEKVTADYIGFTIPPDFVVGYGLDVAERYRNLRGVHRYVGTDGDDGDATLGHGAAGVRDQK